VDEEAPDELGRGQFHDLVTITPLAPCVRIVVASNFL